MGPRPVAPDWLAAIPGPRAIYVGTIDSRLDVEGIAHLAVLRPDLHIVLLGPTPEPGYTRALREIPNVHQHAGVGRSELVAALRNCDVSLLSHRRTALTEAMSPLKVYEYLAAGLPVVSVDLPPVRGIHERVTFSASTAEMAPQVDDALERGPLTDAQRAAFIEDNSWGSRHRAVLELVLRSSARHRAAAPANV
nr:glycosyltransferase [Microbacterium proteolyticum]